MPAANIVPFVTVVDGQYRLDETTAAWLAARERPFAVMACAGKFRTGKSFLLNRLLRTPPGEGFGVGETVQACTRGIWLCKDLLSGEAGEAGVDVLVLDTEGIDALDARCDHDVRVFALAVLLSTVVVYNSWSHLDEAAIQTLCLMTRVAESVQTGAHHPSLYWVLRDFALQLVDASGAPLSHADYLESALAPPVTDKCATREAIKAVFPDRHLVTLPRPHRSDTAQKLDERAASSLAPKFDRFLGQFRSHLVKNARPYAAGGVPLSGAMYVECVRALLTRVNVDGAIPRIEDSWSLIARAQHADEERRAAAALTASALAEAPVDTEERVEAWIRSRDVPLTFMAPAPDANAVRERVVAEALGACRAAGRVRDWRALAHEAAEATWRAYEAAAFSEEAMAVPDEWRGDGERAQVFAARLARYFYDHRDLLVAHGRRLGAEAAREEGSLEERRLAAELEHTRAALADAEARVAARDEAHRAWILRPRDDEAAPAETDAAEDADAGTAAAVETETDSDAAVTVDTERLIAETAAARVALEAAEQRALCAEEAVASGAAREEAMRQAFHEGMDRLRQDTVEQLDAMRQERNRERAECERQSQQRAALAEECDKLRGLTRDAQERSVEMHRSTLDELRRRDADARASADTQREEWACLNARLETSVLEARNLKRRLDDLHEVAEEAKRLRLDARTHASERARSEAELSAVLKQLGAARDENEALRREKADLANRNAVLEASSKLEVCRRSLTGGS